MQNSDTVSRTYASEQTAVAIDSGINIRKHVLPWMMFSIAAMFYCFAYFLRVSPSMMENELTSQFHITATQLGNFSAFYYYAYTPLQIPVGVIVDRFGSRIVLSLAALLASAGVFMFVSTNNFHIACLSRFLMGFGAAFGYITVLKVATYWLPSRLFATAAGLTTAFGMSAAILTNNYLAKAVRTMGYKQSLFFSVIAGVVLSGVIFTFLRSRPKPEHSNGFVAERKTTFKELLASTLQLFKNKQIWYIGIVGCLLYLPATVFLDLWGVPYLERAYHLSHVEAGLVISTVYIGWIIGGPVIGAISDGIKLRRMPLLISSVISAIMICIVFYVPNVPLFWVYVSMFILGLSCGSHPLVFAMARENSSHMISGTATAVTNFLIMSGGLVFQPFVGWLIDIHWSGLLADGLREYTISDYNFALAIVPIGLILSVIITLLIRETNCKVPDHN